MKKSTKIIIGITIVSGIIAWITYDTDRRTLGDGGGELINIVVIAGILEASDYTFLEFEFFEEDTSTSDEPDLSILVDYKSNKFMRLQQWILDKLLVVTFNGEIIKIGKY